MRIVSYTPDSSLPLTIDEVKNFLRITHTDDDAMLQEAIKRITELVEDISGYTLRPTTIKICESNILSRYIAMPFIPVDTVAEVIADDEDITQLVEIEADEIVVLPLYGYNKVYITYQTKAADKEILKQAVMQGVALEYEHRDGTSVTQRMLDILKNVRKVRI
jgi:hypothetical protein